MKFKAIRLLFLSTAVVLLVACGGRSQIVDTSTPNAKVVATVDLEPSPAIIIEGPSEIFVKWNRWLGKLTMTSMESCREIGSSKAPIGTLESTEAGIGVVIFL